ncbi:MAG: lamin tail domain-containing protein, partial [Bacteroidales bacterium]|nr:lamin tail domain-containing protein [Bacteroidales bacterium]
MRNLLIILFLSLNVMSLNAQLASWPLTSDGNPTGVNSNLTATAFTSSGVGTLSFGTDGAYANGWTTSTSIDLVEYFEVTISPTATNSLLISDINFSERRSSTGILNYQVRWSLDDFSTFTTIATVTVPDDDNERDGSISGLSIAVSAGQTLKVRWYGYGAEAGTGTWRINNGSLNIQGIVIKPEPTNHVTSFQSNSSATTYNSITLVWSDNNSSSDVDGFLIKGSLVSYADISAPTDYNPESDGTLIKNIAQGVETVQFTGLTNGVTYYFKIWPYTNSGSNIDYKTGSEPQTNEATITIKVIISEVVDHSTFENEYIELWNIGTTSVNIDGWQIYERFTDNNTEERGVTLNTTSQKNTGGSNYLILEPNEYCIIARNATTLESNFSIDNNIAIFSGTVPRINGYERYQLRDGASKGVVIDAFGDWDSHSTFSASGFHSYYKLNSNDGEISTNWGSTAQSTYYATPGSRNQTSEGVILPINLLSFSAQMQAEGVDLKWVISSEINNDFFTVERAQDGVNFNEVGRVAGAGNSNVERHYSFLDSEMPKAITYYRLRQTDFDGTTTVSKTIQLTPANGNESLQGLYTDHNRNLNIVMNSSVNQQVTVAMFTLD